MKIFKVLKKIILLFLILFCLLIIAWRVDRTFFHPLIPNYSDQIRNDITTSKFTIPQDQESCEQAKGVWKKIGIRSVEECNLPTSDGGKVCRSGSECEGICMANLSAEQMRKGMSGKLFRVTASCSKWVKQVGCFGITFLGWAQVVCVD